MHPFVIRHSRARCHKFEHSRRQFGQSVEQILASGRVLHQVRIPILQSRDPRTTGYSKDATLDFQGRVGEHKRPSVRQLTERNKQQMHLAVLIRPGRGRSAAIGQ